MVKLNESEPGFAKVSVLKRQLAHTVPGTRHPVPIEVCQYAIRFFGTIVFISWHLRLPILESHL